MRYVPHILTAGNLFCGAIAIVQISRGNLLEATWLVFFAGVLDFFDGFAARLLKVTGDLGKQLDSLADMITFGLVPAFLLYKIGAELSAWPFDQKAPVLLLYIPLLIAVFSGLRLAIFNIDTRQSSSFIGVPTPANAFWLCGLPYLIQAYPQLITQGWVSPWSIALLSGISCYLLVAPIPMLSLKVKSFKWVDNETRYLLILSILVSVILFKFAGLLFFVPLYILFSLIHNRLYTNEIRG